MIPVLLSGFLTGPSAGAGLTALERQRLAAHMEMTAGWLETEVSGLSPDQLRFRPSSGAWNIVEVLDHLAVAGPIYWQDFQNAMKAAPGGQPRPDKDAEVLWYGIDRTQRQKALPAEGPKGQLRDPEAALGLLRRLRSQILQHVRTTEDDVRAHWVARERCDAYQWLLLISAHEQRHILQIREIKADAKFPKK